MLFIHWTNIYLLFFFFFKSFFLVLHLVLNSLVDTSLLPSVWLLQCQCNLTLPHTLSLLRTFSPLLGNLCHSLYFNLFSNPGIFSMHCYVSFWLKQLWKCQMFLSIILCKCNIRCETFTSQIYSGLFTSSSTSASCSCWAVDNMCVWVCVSEVHNNLRQ